MDTHPKRLVLASAVIAGVMISYLLWPSGYGNVSDQGYQLTMAVESACGRQDMEGVLRIRTLVRTDPELSDTERGWLDEILVAAEAGSWNEARRMARDLMRAQLVASSQAGGPTVDQDHSS
ncbi:MAG: hypothetical protein ACR2NZ_21625 [Rubripirellula sp.]